MVVLRIRPQGWFAMLAMAGALLVGACASAPPPTGVMSQAELAVRDAERSQASQYAALELQMARENFDLAKQAMQRKEHETARRMAEKALVEARLAEDKALAASTREAAEELRRSIDSLRDEISRASKSR